MKKLKLNIITFISIFTVFTVFFTSCPHNQDPPKYKTLTLTIGKNVQKLYYEDGKWYEGLTSDGNVDTSKVAEGDASFKVATEWIVTFAKGTPDGADASKYNVPESKKLNAGTLTFKVADKEVTDVIDVAGKVLVKSIDNDTNVLGTYAAVRLDDTSAIIGSTEDVNYVFAGWDVDDLAKYEITGDVTITAKWEPSKEVAKTLTIDEKVVAYYKGGKWFSDNECNSPLTDNTINPLPQSSWTVTLNVGDGTLGDGSMKTNTVNRTFNGGFTSQTSGDKKIDEKGVILYENGIIDNTTLYAQWTENKFSKPADPTPKTTNGKFIKWVDGEVAESESADVFKDANEITITKNTTLTAYYDAPRKLTIKGTSDVSYWYMNGTWYDKETCASGEEKDSDFTVANPGPKKITVIVNFDKGTAKDECKTDAYFKESSNEISLAFVEYVNKDGNVKIENSSLKLPTSLDKDTELEAKYETKSLKLPILTKNKAEFKGYLVDEKPQDADTDISITDDINEKTFIAQWVPIYTLTLDETPSAYFKNGAWYSDEKCETALANNTVKGIDPITYKATLDLGNGTIEGDITELTATSEFLGYFQKDAEENAQALIEADGNVSKYTISSDTDLVSKMSKAYYTKPENDPTREKFTFIGWKKNNVPYEFETTEAENGIVLTASWKLTDEPTDEVAPQDVTVWQEGLKNFIAPNTPHDFWSAETKQSLTAKQEKQIIIDGVSETVAYSSDSYTKAVQPLTSGYPTVGTVDAKVSGKYSNNKSFSISLSIIMGEGGSSVTENKAIFIDGDKEPQELDAMILMNYTDSSSEGEIASEYKKPVALMKGVEFDYLDQVEKNIYNNKTYDVYSNVSGEKDIYEKGEVKDSSALTFRFKSNGDITLTLNLTSETEEKTSVPLTINFDIQTVAGGRTVVTADSYMNVKKDGEDFKKFPLKALGYDIEGQ